MPDQYAVARLTPKNHRHEGDNTLVPWPYERANWDVRLVGGPWDTLDEARAAAASSIPYYQPRSVDPAE